MTTLIKIILKQGWQAMKRRFDSRHCFIALLGFLSFMLISYDSAPPRSDKELYLAFHKDITQRARLVDVEYEPFATAVASRDVAKIMNAAKEIEGRVQVAVSRLKETPVPVLQNKDAYKMLKEARNLFSTAYDYRLRMLSNIVDFSKKPSLGSMIEFKKNREGYDKLSALSVAKLMAAGGKLGLKVNEITGVQVAQSN